MPAKSGPNNHLFHFSTDIPQFRVGLDFACVLITLLSEDSIKVERRFFLLNTERKMRGLHYSLYNVSIMCILERIYNCNKVVKL